MYAGNINLEGAIYHAAAPSMSSVAVNILAMSNKYLVNLPMGFNMCSFFAGIEKSFFLISIQAAVT